jgi:hypothetical protein
VSQNFDKAFSFARRVVSGSQGRTQDSFVLGKTAFDLDSLTIGLFREVSLHLLPISALSRLGTPATIERDHRGPNPQFLSCQRMIGFRIKPGIAQQAIQPKVPAGLNHGRGKMGTVVVRASGHNTTPEQVGLRITDGRDFGPCGVLSRAFAGPVKIVGTDMTGLKPGGINGPLGLIRNQIQLPGAVQQGRQQVFKSPFFSNRCSA